MSLNSIEYTEGDHCSCGRISTSPSVASPVKTLGPFMQLSAAHLGGQSLVDRNDERRPLIDEDRVEIHQAFRMRTRWRLFYPLFNFATWLSRSSKNVLMVRS